MNRKSFIANALMAIAVSLLPKILQPTTDEVIEEMIDVTVNISWIVVSENGERKPLETTSQFTWSVPKKDEERIFKYLNEHNLKYEPKQISV